MLFAERNRIQLDREASNKKPIRLPDVKAKENVESERFEKERDVLVFLEDKPITTAANARAKRRRMAVQHKTQNGHGQIPQHRYLEKIYLKTSSAHNSLLIDLLRRFRFCSDLIDFRYNSPGSIRVDRFFLEEKKRRDDAVQLFALLESFPFSKIDLTYNSVVATMKTIDMV